VFDYVGSTNWSNGDNESYANGDLMAHQYASTASTVDFEYKDIGTVGSGIAIALKPASSPPQAQAPGPPTGLTVTVH
jgi:hypothetical protein